MTSISMALRIGKAWRFSKGAQDIVYHQDPDLALRDFVRELSSRGHDEPTRKRRRLSPARGDVKPDPDQPERAHLTVAHISVDLGLEYSPSPSSPEDGVSRIPVPVCLDSLEDHTSLRKKIGIPSSDNILLLAEPLLPNGSGILLHHKDVFPPRVTQILRLVFRLRLSQKNKKTPGLAWAEACLVGAWNGLSTAATLEVKIFWNMSAVASNPRASLADELLAQFFPKQEAETLMPWSPQDFYENVHIPPKDLTIPSRLKFDELECQLYPFQKRALVWLLQQEGVRINDTGQVVPDERDVESLPSLFEETKDAEGRTCYVSHLLGEVAMKPWSCRSWYTQLKGGILAEEMGLGKTVELIALLSVHRRKEPQQTVLDTYTNTNVITSPATLIVTPPAILQQWKNELASHAPSLRVYEYKGMKGLSHEQTDQLKTELLEYDVVIATYGVIAREIHFTNEKPKREFRQEKKYIPRRSPLVQIQWWRVCLDEAQMVESGVSNAATVARLVPRCNAWAVTGTPLRKDVQDLLGLLIFLRYEPFCDPQLWRRMITSHRRVFKDIFNRIALRHTKSKIREELHLPPQKRIVITVPFTAIEEQHYGQVFQQMCEDCGLDSQGGPLQDDWNPNAPHTVEAMRNWLTRLRQTCLHPEVGGRNRRALGYRDGPLRTVDEVLQVMIDQNETALRTEERAVIMSKMLQGHVILYGKESRRALEIFLAAIDQVDNIVSESRSQFEQERAAQINNDNSSAPPDEEESSDTDENESEDKKGRLGACRQRLRGALEVQHVCYFFTANAYFEIKTASGHAEESEEYQALEKLETEYYEKAKVVRKELLHEASAKAERLMKSVNDRMEDKKRITIPIIAPISHSRGIESRKIVDNIEKLRALLNAQTVQYKEWREKMVELITARLLDEENGIEMTGDEYETSTKQQDEQYVYLDALRCLIADRHCLLTGQVNLLINYEMKEALKHAKEGAGHAPELLQTILAKRRELMPAEDLSFRGLMSDIRSVVTSVRWQEGDRSNRATAEAAILERELEGLQKISSSQMKVQTVLEKDLDLFRSTMNQRLEFYRQLQQISDAVAPLQEEADEQVDEVRVQAEYAKESLHATKLATLMTKRRFLLHLRTESTIGEQQRICVICQSSFETGVLTVCGHQYCKDCIRQWWHEHRNCPMCKRHLKVSDFHTITYKPRDLRAQEETSTMALDGEGGGSPSITTTPSKSSIYSSIQDSTLNEIRSYDLNGSYGTKIDTLSRHILWIREHDPGAKSIIFSQYRDFLSVLARAFRHFKIGCTEISTKGSITAFQTDPSIECFLLHAKADSSGLNLVNATHVFLCEPLINAAIELQAIARVHRIGQRRPTCCWMYLVSDTVEEAIYDISVSRRLSHIARTSHSTSNYITPAPTRSGTATPSNRTPMHNQQQLEETALDAANSLELQHAPISKLLTKGQSGGEMVNKDDLWHCLFHKPRKPDPIVSAELEREVGRHLRAEAAEDRRAPMQTA